MANASIAVPPPKKRKTVDEHRHYQRAPIDLNVEFVRKDAGASSEVRFKGRAKDISLGGMFVETTHPLPFATEVVVSAAIQSGKPAFALPAVVRWTREDGMGIQFRTLGARETHAIMDLMKGAARLFSS
jgi:type IV pilus assembly protein PilZ